jgi:hypothetical protein
LLTVQVRVPPVWMIDRYSNYTHFVFPFSSFINRHQIIHYLQS